MRTIVVANQKGGCGKTTTAVNLSAALAQAGMRSLLIDFDPQAHATLGLGCEPDGLGSTARDVLMTPDMPIEKAVVRTHTGLLSLLPCNILLAAAELELNLTCGWQFVLSEKLRDIAAGYDTCIIDCPPSLGMLTLSALVAGTDVVVPVQAHYYAMEGLRQLLQTVTIIRRKFSPCDVRILGLLLTFVEDRLTLSRQIQRQMRDYFGDLVFETVIHKSTLLLEAPSAGESVITYAPESRAAIEYSSLAEEISGGAALPPSIGATFDNEEAAMQMV